MTFHRSTDLGFSYSLKSLRYRWTDNGVWETERL